jgi:hypothetical protein
MDNAHEKNHDKSQDLSQFCTVKPFSRTLKNLPRVLADSLSADLGGNRWHYRCHLMAIFERTASASNLSCGERKEHETEQQFMGMEIRRERFENCGQAAPFGHRRLSVHIATIRPLKISCQIGAPERA